MKTSGGLLRLSTADSQSCRKNNRVRSGIQAYNEVFWLSHPDHNLPPLRIVSCFPSPALLLPGIFYALRCRDFLSSLQLTYHAAAWRLFRTEFEFSEARSVDIFSVGYVALKDIRTRTSDAAEMQSRRESIADIRIRFRLMLLDVIETRAGCMVRVRKLSFEWQ